jgi:hypothetical protein
MTAILDDFLRAARAADAGADGRETVTGVLSLPPHGRTDAKTSVLVAASQGAKQAASARAAPLRDQLTRAAPDTGVRADWAPRTSTALGAGRTWQLMAGGDDGTCPG